MIKKTQNINFHAKLTPQAKNFLKANKHLITPETRQSIIVLDNDKATKDLKIDIVLKKILAKDYFSFILHPNNKTMAKLTPHHPQFVRDDKFPGGLRPIPKKRNFYWKNINEMFQNDILKPEKLKKILNTWQEQRDNLDKWLKTDNSDKKIYEYAGITGQKTAELIHLTEVKK